MHAVAVNSRFESAVMKSIATLGDGSLHRITGEAGPATVARQLLAELTQPATRILKVEFPGLMTARVYPEDFPRLPAGTQQIVLGRYLPAADSAEREVIVTAQRGDETFQMRKQVSLKEADQGNSFIPRLWARMHLDALLAARQFRRDPGRDHRLVGRVPHHHALHVAVGPGNGCRSRAVPGQAAVSDA